MTPMSPEDRLSRAFAFDEPPARDFGFTLELMEKLARRRLQFSLLMTIPPVLIVAVLLWALVPVFQPLAVAVAQGVWPAVPAAILAAVLALVSWQFVAPSES
jgi:hypothetical protein